jgi:DNA-binding IclR family transcriptional regulator
LEGIEERNFMNKRGNSAARHNSRQGTKRLSSVTTAIHLMKLFTADHTEMGISELAARLGTAKSTTHRLATALLLEGLLEQNPDNGRYRLGFGLFSLGALARARINVATEAKPLLSALRDTTGENARLAVLDRRQVVFMHDIASPQSLGLQSCTGQYRPAHCTAEGLCLLANLPPDLRENSLAAPLHSYTQRTLTDADQLRNRLERVRRAGYAIEDEEFEEGTRCIAAPVFQEDGVVAAAIGVAGPRMRIRKREFASTAAVVQEAAQRLSHRLGYRAAQSSYAQGD